MLGLHNLPELTGGYEQTVFENNKENMQLSSREARLELATGRSEIYQSRLLYYAGLDPSVPITASEWQQHIESKRRPDACIRYGLVACWHILLTLVLFPIFPILALCFMWKLDAYRYYYSVIIMFFVSPIFLYCLKLFWSPLPESEFLLGRFSYAFELAPPPRRDGRFTRSAQCMRVGSVPLGPFGLVYATFCSPCALADVAHAAKGSNWCFTMFTHVCLGLLPCGCCCSKALHGCYRRSLMAELAIHPFVYDDDSQDWPDNECLQWYYCETCLLAQELNEIEIYRIGTPARHASVRPRTAAQPAPTATQCAHGKPGGAGEGVMAPGHQQRTIGSRPPAPLEMLPTPPPHAPQHPPEQQEQQPTGDEPYGEP